MKSDRKIKLNLKEKTNEIWQNSTRNLRESPMKFDTKTNKFDRYYKLNLTKKKNKWNLTENTNEILINTREIWQIKFVREAI